MVRLYFVLQETENHLPKLLHYFIVSPAMDESSCCATSLPAIGIFSILDFNQVLFNMEILVRKRQISSRIAESLALCTIFFLRIINPKMFQSPLLNTLTTVILGNSTHH